VGAPGTRALACSIVVVIGATAMTACGGDSNRSSSAKDTSNEVSTSLGPGNESDYVGLTKRAAIAKAEGEGRPWRITREDREMFPGTLDYNPDRVQFEIDNGRVTKATFG
jgi:hypothetical protein